MVHVLTFRLSECFKWKQDALILLWKLLIRCPSLSFLFNPKAGIPFLLFLHSIFQPVCHYLQGLPSNLPKSRLRQRELFHIFGPLYKFDRSSIHPLLSLASSKRIQIFQQKLILAEHHEPLEKDIDSEVQIVVVVTLHPLLNEVVISVGRQNNPIWAIG